jgi:hypothetical protein
MSTSNRLGELRTKVLPYIIKNLAANPNLKFQNSAEVSDAAVNNFEEVVMAAQRYCGEHSHDDRETRCATVGHMFTELGILPLEAVQIAEELFPKPGGEQ